MRTALAVAAAMMLLTGAARAQTCTAAATAAAFGTYQPLTANANTTTTTVTVTCNPGVISLFVSYTVMLSTGTSGTFTSRKLGGTATPLLYQIYLDVGLTQVWGDGSAGTSFINDGYSLGVIFPVIKTYTGFGRIAGGQHAAAGVYGDALTVLVNY